MSDRKQRPFIPSWLDEEGLSPAEMRVFVHLLRSADKDGVAWPSYARMTAISGLGKSTVRRAIEELKRRELILAVGKPFAGSCRYKVLPIVPPEGQMEDSNSSTGGTIEAPPIVPPQNRNSSTSIPPIVPPEGQEGNPLKGIHLRESKEEGLPFPSEKFAKAWAEWETHRREIRKTLTPLARQKQLKALADMGEARAIAAIAHSIEKGWTGIFERSGGAPYGKTGAMTDEEAIAALGGRAFGVGGDPGSGFGCGPPSKPTLADLMGGRSLSITKATDLKE